MIAPRRDQPPTRAFLWLVVLFILLALPLRYTLALLVCAVAARLIKRHARHRPRRAPLIEDGVQIGHDLGQRPVRLSDRQLAAHGLILGATGAGKTTTLIEILAGEVARGRGVVTIDLKGSTALIDRLSTAAKAAARPFHLWTPDGPGHWNPLAEGNPTELKDKLISTERWSEPHYQRAAERYLQTTLRILHTTRPYQAATLAEVVALLEPKRLAVRAGKLPALESQQAREYLSALTPDQRSGIAGLASRLAVITESHTGQYLQPNGPGTINLRRALAQNEVVLFSLNSSTYGKLAAHLAALIIQDLTAAAGHRLNQAHKPLALIAIDEFSALEADNILSLLARAREAGISALLTTQELADLDRAAGLRDQILGNVALTIAHRQNVPASAELIARLVGTHPSWQRTYQTDSYNLLGQLLGRPGPELETGLGTKRQVEEFRIHPNTIKELPTGQAILITKIPTAYSTIVQINSARQDASNAH